VEVTDRRPKRFTLRVAAAKIGELSGGQEWATTGSLVAGTGGDGVLEDSSTALACDQAKADDHVFTSTVSPSSSTKARLPVSYSGSEVYYAKDAGAGFQVKNPNVRRRMRLWSFFQGKRTRPPTPSSSSPYSRDSHRPSNRISSSLEASESGPSTMSFELASEPRRP